MDRVPARIGDWDPEGVGFHRVALRVGEVGAAVRARFSWRTRQHAPEDRALIVTAASGEPVANVHRLSVTREECDLLFEPVSGLAESRMLGYWSPRCPVRTGRQDVLATAYVRKGESVVIALARWAPEPADVRLALDWSGLGLEPGRLLAPAIRGYQAEAHYALEEPIGVAPGKGWLLVTG